MARPGSKNSGSNSSRSSGKRSILDDVRRELKEDAENNVDIDDEYDGNRDPNNLGSLLSAIDGRKPKHPDEIAIDEMLIGLDGNDWYLKLSKETAPNVWQFKRRISEFRHWADMELQINLLVQQETAAEVKRRGKVISWGSGRYMITFFSDNGLRGNKRKPVFFDIDAQEPEATPPTSQQNEMLDVLRETITSPKDVIEQNVQSMQKGMELAAMASGGNKNGNDNMFALMMNQSNNQTQMMIGLITAMMGAMGGNNKQDPLDFMRGMVGTMKDVGAFPTQTNPQQSLTEQLTTFKLLGLIKDPSENDPISVITKMKGVFSMLGDLTGAGPAERPGIMEKLIDAVGPHIGKLMGAVENISAMKAAEAARVVAVPADQRPIMVQQAPQTRQIIQVPSNQPNPQPMVAPRQTPKTDYLGFPSDTDNPGGYDGPDPRFPMPDLPLEAYQQVAAERQVAGIQPSQPQQGDIQEMAVNTAALMVELAQAVHSSDYNKFGRITQVLDTYFGPGVARQQIFMGQLDAKTLVSYIVMFDKTNYTTPEAMNKLGIYVTKYVEYMKNPPSTTTSQIVTAKCDTCGKEQDLDNIAQWNDEIGEGNGRVICNRDGCQGSLHLI
jgi:hypothetical protein